MGLILLRTGVDEIVQRLQDFDPAIQLSSDGFTSYSLGVGGYTPSCMEEQSEPPESVIVFVRGHYE